MDKNTSLFFTSHSNPKWWPHISNQRTHIRHFLTGNVPARLTLLPPRDTDNPFISRSDNELLTI